MAITSEEFREWWNGLTPDEQAWEMQQVQAALAAISVQRLTPEELASLAQEVQVLTQEGFISVARLIDQKRASRPFPTTPDVFSTGYAQVSSTLTVQGVLAAMWDAASGADGWQPPIEGYPPAFRHTTESGNSTLIQYMRDPKEILDDKASKSFWEQVKEFTDRDIDVTMGLLAHLTLSPDDAWFFANRLLDYRGVKPIMKKDAPGGRERRAGHRQEDILDIGQSVDRVSTIWVTLDQHIDEKQEGGKRKKRKRTQYTLTSRFILIKEVFYQRELDTGMENRSMPIGWRVQAGTWLKTFLEKPNRHVAYLCHQALKYDPHNEMWEKRLAYYTMFHARMNVHGGGGVFHREIEKLLNELSLPIDPRFPERNTKQRFEKALNRLKEDRQIDDWEYIQEGALQPRKWLATWLKWKVRIFIAPTQHQIGGARNA